MQDLACNSRCSHRLCKAQSLQVGDLPSGFGFLLRSPERYTEKTDEWLKGLVGSESFAIKASFLCSLDITNETIRLVEELIDEDHEELYWNKVFVLNAGEDVYRYVVEHLKKVNRYDDIVETL